jgi:phosphatidylglycerol:prolipoprotein diacylglycerol transferase
MHPILFQIGSFTLGTYGLLLLAGFLAGLFLARHLGKRDALLPDALTDLAVSVLLGGILGSKLLMIVVDLVNGMPFSQVFSFATLRAGGAVHGGVIGGLLMFFWRIRALRLPLPQAMDALAPAVALGQAIGRWGCVFAGCCYGSETHVPWAITFTNHEAELFSGTPLGVALHPVQIYNSLANFAVLGLLLLLGRKRRFAGHVGAAYFLLEGAGRLLTEAWRGDLDRGVWLGLSWLSTGRLTGLAFMLVGVGLWAWFQRYRKEVRA